MRLSSPLLAGLSVREAARHAGISEPTARRRLKDDAFREQLAAARAEMLDQAIAMLSWASGAAVVALADIARGGRNEAARVAAARTILELGLTRARHGAVSATELEKIVGTIIGAAIDRLTEEQAPAFLREVDRALLGP